MAKSLVVRMNYNTLKRLMIGFPSYHGETMSNYFKRLATYLNQLKGGNERANGN